MPKSFLIAVIGVVFGLTACDSKTPDAQTQLANPASVYCGEIGGTHNIKKDLEDNEIGVCRFSDGQYCDEWALFRGECVPVQAVAEPFRWCGHGASSPVLNGLQNPASLPDKLIKPMLAAGLVTDAMPLDLLKQTRWRCMGGDVWVCMIGANLPCNERADTTKTPSDKMLEFCQSNPNSESIPAFVTGRATVYEWRCKADQPTAGRQFAKADAAGYISNIWHRVKP